LPPQFFRLRLHFVGPAWTMGQKSRLGGAARFAMSVAGESGENPRRYSNGGGQIKANLGYFRTRNNFGSRVRLFPNNASGTQPNPPRHTSRKTTQ